MRVMQLWLRKEVPVENVSKMVAWYAALPGAQQAKLTPAFRKRITEERIKLTASSDKSGAPDPEYAEFESSYSSGGINDQTALADLKKQFAFYQWKQRTCSQRKDEAGASAALNQLKDLGSVIHDIELRAQKLGRDLGDLVPRKTLESPARFIGMHLLRCADAAISEVIAALKVSDPTSAPLTPEEIQFRIEPILLNAFILQPIRRAAHGDNPAAPPDWLVAALEAGLAEVLEGITLDRTPTPAVPGA